MEFSIQLVTNQNGFLNINNILGHLNDCQQPSKSSIRYRDTALRECMCVKHFNWFQWEIGYESVHQFFFTRIQKKNFIFHVDHEQIVYFVNVHSELVQGVRCLFIKYLKNKTRKHEMEKSLKNKFKQTRQQK